jgi:hypothetical protein
VFKHNPQVAEQFNFDRIMAIVTSIWIAKPLFKRLQALR